PRAMVSDGRVDGGLIERLLAGAGDRAPSLLMLDADAALWRSGNTGNPDPEELGLRPEHLAYVIYTSGSTGTPKGVMIEHRSLVNYTLDAIRWFGLSRDDRVLLQNSLNFDLSIEELAPALLAGASLLPSSKPYGTEAMVASDSPQNPTVIHFTTAHWQSLVTEWTASPDRAEASMEGVRLINVTGDVLPLEKLRQWEKLGMTTTLINTYGPTEATVSCTADYARYMPDVARASIGKPFANTRIYILDAYRQPVPVGVVGELFIGGIGVGRGYLNQPELTAERFLEDPFFGGLGNSMYKTGDLARWLQNGTIEFAGRNDFQVKVRGFRIELGEIEAKLMACEDVLEAAVLARDDVPGEKHLVAYYLAEGAVDVSALRDRLSESLPDYMVPTAFVRVSAWPLTPNGKIDRKALPAPGEEAYARREFEAAQGPTEQAIARIWMQVLKRERVGRRDNFFELGGHSLLVIHLIEKMRIEGFRADVEMIFKSSTLADFAKCVVPVFEDIDVPPNRIPEHADRIEPWMLTLVSLNQSQIDRVVAQVPGGAANVQDIYPLAPLQEGILYEYLSTERGDPYLLSAAFEFDTESELDAYLAALHKVVLRHTVLRTSIVWAGIEQPIQVVLRSVDIPVDRYEFAEDAENVAERLAGIYDPGHYRLDLASAPLIRCATAYAAQSGRWVLFIVSHHVVLDQASMDLIDDEIRMILHGREKELPPSSSFREFIVRAGSVMGNVEHRRFFECMLADIQEPSAPFGCLRKPGANEPLLESKKVLSDMLSRRIVDVVRGCSVSPASFMHLAWALVVARTTNRSSAVFGTLLFGRMHGAPEAQRMLGMLINTLPLKIDIDKKAAASVLRSVHQSLAELIAHEHAPLALAQRCSAVPQNLPLFTSLLNYRRGVISTASIEEAGGRYLRGHERTTYPLAVAVDDFGHSFEIGVRAVSEIDTERVLAYFETVLGRLLLALEDGGSTSIDAIDPMPESESRLLAEMANGPALRTTGPAASLHSIFEARAVERPDEIALIHAGAMITCRELEAQANQLAHYLIEQGVGNGDIVALISGRGVTLIVAILAIIKTGAAYLPLDPDAPPERNALILADAKAKRLLVDKAGRCCGEYEGVVQIAMDDAASWIVTQPQTPPLVAGPWSQRAVYVIYTSGTTGIPKGVVASHSNLINFCAGIAESGLAPAGGDTILFAPYTFDASAGEIFSALSNGLRLHLLDDAAIRDPELFMRYVLDHDIDFIALPPAYLQQLDPKMARPDMIIMTAGSAPSPDMVERWAGCCRYYNAYGPTETTVLSTIARLTPADDRITIGRPIVNTQAYVLNEAMQPAPIGVDGDLYIGGDGVTLGYLNREELTAERFLRDPFVPGRRMYRTGDLAHWTVEGALVFRGRADFQMKVRGYRIEPGEIETTVCSYDGIAEAIAVLREDRPGDARIVAYFIAHENVLLDALRAHARRHLPEYMLPAAYVQLREWPLTPHGKIDRKALHAPEAEAYAVRAYSPPGTDTERALAGIWADLLQIERVGCDDDFFELGGHSLLAIRLSQRANAAIGCGIGVADVFSAPRLSDLAKRIDSGHQHARYVNGKSEAWLDETIRPQSVDDVPRSPAKAVLLTGATGFVGRFLLRRLLDTTSATIYCLVRGESEQMARERLFASMRRWRLWNPHDEDRVIVCLGDLARPGLQLSPADRSRLIDGIDAILHNGTSMNHLEPYSSAKLANVEGVRELLRIAATGRTKTFDYISTLNVFSAITPHADGERIDETSSIEHELHLDTDGYAASKWVGECLVLLAMERGMPCDIFRLGLVAGDSHAGRYDEKQALHRTMVSAIRMRAGGADDRRDQRVMPVDYVVEAIVALSERHRTGGGIFHLSSSSTFSMDQLYHAYEAATGKSLATIPYSEWLRRIDEYYQSGTVLPVYPLVQHLLNDEPSGASEAAVYSTGQWSLSCAQTDAELAELGIAQPVVDERLLALYWRALLVEHVGSAEDSDVSCEERSSMQ
ncbi:MAG: amino acid adenylation domain-containing protein, partial [Lysobacteraceae bacterium]